MRVGRQPIFALLARPDPSPRRSTFATAASSSSRAENFDGEWIARNHRRFGYGTARGSTSRGGARALVQLRRELAAGRAAAFTVDGPRGPARVAQPGAVWLAGATGHPVLPFHLEADRCWAAQSWDRTRYPSRSARGCRHRGTDGRRRHGRGLSSGAARLEQRLGLLEAKCRKAGSRFEPVAVGELYWQLQLSTGLQTETESRTMLLICSPRFEEHVTPPGHPERLERAGGVRQRGAALGARRNDGRAAPGNA